MGDVRALLAGGAVVGGATIVGGAVGATQAAMISLMAYRMFKRPPNAPKSKADATYALGHRLAKHLLKTSGRSVTAITAAETAASIYMGLRAFRDNYLRKRTPLLLPPPADPGVQPLKKEKP